MVRKRLAWFEVRFTNFLGGKMHELVGLDIWSGNFLVWKFSDLS